MVWSNLGSNTDSANVESLNGVFVALAQLTNNVSLGNLQGERGGAEEVVIGTGWHIYKVGVARAVIEGRGWGSLAW